MSRIASAWKVSGSHLSHTQNHAPRPRGAYTKDGDAELLERIRAVVDERPSYGYRRVHALLRRQPGYPPVNHKRVHRVMKQAGLLLSRGHPHPNRSHDGQVITLKSNLRWCTDIFEVRCWDGRKLHAAFVLDCCDREAIAWVAKPQHLTAQDICDLMAEAVESRFSDTSVPHPIEWLSDNGGAFTAYETRRFAASCGLLVRTTPAYSPESNGMAEAFVKTFKRDYAYLSDVGSPEQVMRQLPAWFDDHNEITPHKGLGMLSPRMYLRANQ